MVCYHISKVYVVDQHESLQRGEELPLNITLTHYVSNTPAAPGVLIVDPASCAISKSGEFCIPASRPHNALFGFPYIALLSLDYC